MRRFTAALLGVAAIVALLATPVRAAGVPGLHTLRAHIRPAPGHPGSPRSAHSDRSDHSHRSGTGRPGSGPADSDHSPCLLNLLGLVCLL
ncbi:hypothetical protein [Streptomyces huiliensis]|uniref:hypothetical protein n=1 Tax=Streptomyces huiliensis TaxID=2876027 RepID=UPI001CBE6415|nr:hypothetical protein [Streptomyces huiliensis]MBZ4319494.1 hypothetical protein [Streptomyces huiliensis]